MGSLPGQDMPEAIRMVMGELGERPGVPFLPELPQRGVGADMVGRGTALLVDLYAEVQPSGWRIADRPGRDHGRARSHLSSDLDLLEEYTQGYTGPLKIQAVGPWTLASTVELPHGDKLLADSGAVRDVAESLAEGLRLHIADVRKRVPGAHVILQLDEPALPGVLKGTVPTASGFGSLRAVEETVAREQLRTVIEGVRFGDNAADASSATPVIVHCCAPDVPFDTLRRAGATGISFDMSLLRERHDEALGELIESQILLFAGIVPSADPASAAPGVTPSVKGLSDRVLALSRLGFPGPRLAQSVVVTPSCGLAGASPGWARRALKLCRDTARALEELD
ncbi:MAG TPA: methionine synthase [Actinocrinis sp.]|uniref:methionine synthase n=1 Tax=Actinocrinis sp. TaxID=1920516 RepID=UPI002D539B87|nr:methionine synthase [Actinocrinis sp.]HZU55503.1 methionine synthase [Actinocrinis sp.]